MYCKKKKNQKSVAVCCLSIYAPKICGCVRGRAGAQRLYVCGGGERFTLLWCWWGKTEQKVDWTLFCSRGLHFALRGPQAAVGWVKDEKCVPANKSKTFDVGLVFFSYFIFNLSCCLVKSEFWLLNNLYASNCGWSESKVVETPLQFERVKKRGSGER